MRNVSSSFPRAAGPRLERGNLAQALIDILTVLFWLALAALIVLSVVGAAVILLCAAGSSAGCFAIFCLLSL